MVYRRFVASRDGGFDRDYYVFFGIPVVLVSNLFSVFALCKRGMALNENYFAYARLM